MNNNKINALNGLKGWMIYVIVFYHTFKVGNGLGIDFGSIKNYFGILANSIFFAVSGYLTSYAFDSNNKIEYGFINFIFNKIKRIYPVYFIFNLVQLITIMIIPPGYSFDIKGALYVFLLQTGGAFTDYSPYVGPGWFVCTLVVCFVIFYFVKYISFKSGKQIVAPFLFTLLIMWGIVLLYLKLNIPYCYKHDGEGFLSFFLGCLMHETYTFIYNKRKYFYTITIISGFIGILLAKMNILTNMYLFDGILLVPGIILSCIEVENLNKFFNSKISTFLGKICTWVFLSHTLIVLTGIMEKFDNDLIGFIVYFIAVIIISIMGTYVLKKVFNERKPSLN